MEHLLGALGCFPNVGLTYNKGPFVALTFPLTVVDYGLGCSSTMISKAAEWNFDIDHYLNRIAPRSRLDRLPSSVSRWLGYRKEPKKDVGNILQAFWSLVGAFCGLAVISAVFANSPLIQRHHPPVLIASFGASAVLEYNVIKSPLGQPRNALLGHTFSAIVGVAVTKLFLYSSDFESLRWVAGAIACGLASAVMLLTNTVHPPGGASAMLAATMSEITAMGWYFVGLVMLGTTLMLLVSLVTNNIQRQFPTYWWTPVDLRNRDLATHDFVPDARGSIQPREPDLNFHMVTRDQITITAKGVDLPKDFPLNLEEAQVLERLMERLLATQTDDEKQTTSREFSPHSTIVQNDSNSETLASDP